MSWSYPGGKSNHAKWIVPELPEIQTYDTYVEVFGGAFWVFTKGLGVLLKDHGVIYNDADPFLANDWFCIVNERDDLLDICESLPPHDLELFNKFKAEVEPIEWDTVDIGDLDLASKHLYLMVQRFVAPGFTLPKLSKGQKPKWIRFIKDLTEKSDIFDTITEVENLDFETVIKKYDSEKTLFYVDPPYYSTETYYHHEFPREDHLRLAEVLRQIKGKFALSYYEFPELNEWFPKDKYPRHEHDARNMMGAKAGKITKGKDIEILVKNYSPNEALCEGKRDLIEY